MIVNITLAAYINERIVRAADLSAHDPDTTKPLPAEFIPKPRSV